MQTFERFWQEHSEWSQSTFGADAERGPVGALKHLAKEVGEALADPSDRMEYADLVFLAFDAARRSGLTADQLVATCFEKLAINRARHWPAPTGRDEPTEHVRS